MRRRFTSEHQFVLITFTTKTGKFEALRSRSVRLSESDTPVPKAAPVTSSASPLTTVATSLPDKTVVEPVPVASLKSAGPAALPGCPPMDLKDPPSAGSAVTPVSRPVFNSPSVRASPPQKKIVVVDHPVAQHALTVLRNKHTESHHFRIISNQLLVLLVLEATRSLPTRPESNEASSNESVGQVLAKPVVFVTIARHGLGLAHRLAEFFPSLLVGAISLERSDGGKHAETRLHLPNAPALSDARVILFDPIVATGSSACQAIKLVRRTGALDISVVSFVVSAPGVDRIHTEFPTTAMWTASIETKLDARRGPIPGLGDLAQRLYG